MHSSFPLMWRRCMKSASLSLIAASIAQFENVEHFEVHLHDQDSKFPQVFPTFHRTWSGTFKSQPLRIISDTATSRTSVNRASFRVPLEAEGG